MKKLLAVWVLLLAAVSANAADKKCPGTVHFLDGRTLECTSITIPGWIDAEVSVRKADAQSLGICDCLVKAVEINIIVSAAVHFCKFEFHSLTPHIVDVNKFGRTLRKTAFYTV